MAEVYEKYFEYWTLQWKSAKKKSPYSDKWHGLNPDVCPEIVYRAFCEGWSAHDLHCFVRENTAIKCFHIMQKIWRKDPDHNDCNLRLVYIKRRVKTETEQIVQS